MACVKQKGLKFRTGSSQLDQSMTGCLAANRHLQERNGLIQKWEESSITAKYIEMLRNLVLSNRIERVLRCMEPACHEHAPAHNGDEEVAGFGDELERPTKVEERVDVLERTDCHSHRKEKNWFAGPFISGRVLYRL